MDTKDIRRLLKPLQLNAFYLDTKSDYYKVDQNNFKQLVLPLDKYLDDMYNMELEVNTTTHNPKIDLINNFKQNLKNYESKLFQIMIPNDDFIKFLQNAKETKEIKEYKELKESIWNIGSKFYYFDDIENFDSLMENTDDEDDDTQNDYHAETTVKTVLNHNNPFADIHIKNQSFLYPDTKGNFKTLSFNLGNQLTKLENSDAEILALQPNFKISKSNNRKNLNVPITFDNTITNKMPESQGHTTLLYI